MATIAITGSAGGMGAATRARLESAGHRVIGVDVRDAEVIADLATPDGRGALVEGVRSLAPHGLDGLIAAAGVIGPTASAVVSINYFGAIATLRSLQPFIKEGAAAVAISSNSTTTFPAMPINLVDACKAGDEAAALAVAGDMDPVAAYPATKLALAHWVRVNTPDWIAAGVRLNALAPGLISTPMTHETEEAVLGLGKIYPIPIGRAGRPEEIAALLDFLLSPDAAFIVGSVIFIDGGTDAAIRAADWPKELHG